MTGSIIKRGKTYTIIFDIGYDETGKRKQKTKGGFLRKADAQKALNEMISKVQNGAYFESSSETLAVFLKTWLNNYVEKNLAVNTIAGYRTLIEKHIIPCIGKIQLRMLKPATIQSFYSYAMDKGLSATTVLYAHRVLHKALKQAVRLQLIQSNPADAVEPPRKQTYKSNVLSESAAKQLINAAQGSEIYMSVLLGLMMGLRRGETLALRWSDFDFEKHTISVSHSARRGKDGTLILDDTKTKKSQRTLVMSDALMAIFKNEQLQQREARLSNPQYNPDNLISCRKDGSYLSTSVLNNQFRKLLAAYGLPHIRFHDLRHTYATLLLKHNIPAKIASERLGHSNIGTTLNLYSHVNTEMQSEAAIALDSILA